VAGTATRIAGLVGFHDSAIQFVETIIAAVAKEFILVGAGRTDATDQGVPSSLLILERRGHPASGRR
jgi:hypothetical protein